MRPKNLFLRSGYTVGGGIDLSRFNSLADFTPR